MCLLWHTKIVKKVVEIDKQAKGELSKFPTEVYAKFIFLFEVLEEEGRLELPYAKKLQGYGKLFEIRVKHRGQWRAVYAYLSGDMVIVLSAFGKKTQKTPIKEIDKAKSRLKFYL